MKIIPIMKPLLPKAKKLLPYLKQIDENRWYSNSGPLVRKFEDRLSEEKFGGVGVVTASSATSALTACLMALELPKNSMVAVPSWTFCATVNAIIAAGHVPYFQEIYQEVMGGVPVSCAAAVYVASLGKPCSVLPSGTLPKIIDAAAGFDSYDGDRILNIPVVFSTHCTKSFSTGEGGLVVCRDRDFLNKVREILNNGFDSSRKVEHPGINGKMSEYHAAVGLAELNGWPEKRARWLEVQKLWSDDKSWTNSTHSIFLDGPAEPAVEKLAELGIQARTSWYGCHKYPAYAELPRTKDLSVTEDLMEHTLFLPKYIGMTAAEVGYVKKALTACV